jgi:phosphoserine phosphatase
MAPLDSDDKAYDASPEFALSAIAAHAGPILVDLDETLYLRNSTEDFIDQAQPGLMALLLLRLLDIVKPWRWTGGEATRDVWRVQLIHRLFPWTLPRWRSQVARLAQQFANRPLLDALRARGTAPVIVTVGFLPIVTPLIAALGLPDARIVAARLNSFADRRLGKLDSATQALGEPTLRGALLITDSPQDLPLLRLCALPLRTVWPQARYRRALSRVYLPGQYISQVKRPNEHYFRRAVLQEDYAFWVLSTISLAGAPLYHAAGLLLLLCSFWIIYERGYVDNDLMGAKLEKQPKLSAAFHESPVATPFWQPWIWATAIGVAGLWVLRLPQAASLADFLRWEGLLIATLACFTLYNRSPIHTRIWTFSVLQLARGTACVVVVAVVPIGAMALGANVLARWTPYYLYRLAGQGWPVSARVGLIRVLFFLVLALMLGVSEGARTVFNWTALALLACSLLRAWYDVRPAPGSRWSGKRKPAA